MSVKLPTRKEAVYRIINEARAERRRKHAHAKTFNALMALGIDNIEAIEILHYLELGDEKGNPYP